MTFEKEYSIKKAEADKYLFSLSDKLLNIPEPLQSSIRYSLFGSGKRVRPVLFLEVLKLFGKNISTQEILFMGAIECIHAYSLIHDDLPCMDDDSFRRGKPTNHKVYGEGIAVLAGDALLNFAYELLFEAIDLSGGDKKLIKAARLIANSCGACGLIAGQTIDIYSKDDVMTPEKLDFIYKHKTGDLIGAAVSAGAIIAAATETEINALKIFASDFGYAFQIKDDILDFEQKIQHDIKNYVDLFGIKSAKNTLSEKINSAVKSLASIKGDISFLKKFALKSISRKE